MKFTNITYSGSMVEHPDQKYACYSTTPSRSGLCMTLTYRSSSALSFNPIIRRNASLCEREAECGRYNAIPRLCGDRNCICLYPYFGGSKNFDHGGDSRIMRRGDIG